MKTLRKNRKTTFFTIILFIIVIISFSYSRKFNTNINQIHQALKKGFSIVEHYHKLVVNKKLSKNEAIHRIKILLSGPLKKIHIRIVYYSVDFLELFSRLNIKTGKANIKINGNYVLLNNKKIGVYIERKRVYEINDPDLISRIDANLKNIPQKDFRNIVQKYRARFIHDFSKAKVKIKKSGYVFVITGNPKNKYNGFAYEVIHPAISGINVWRAKSLYGVYVGKKISEMDDKIDKLSPGQIIRYSYLWKNPTDPMGRKKILLMKYFKPWNWVVCSGLYEDE